MAGHKRAATASSVGPELTAKKSPMSSRFPKSKSLRFLKNKSKSLPVSDETRSCDGGQTESSTRDDDPSRTTPPQRPHSSSATLPISNVTLNVDEGTPSSSALKDLRRVMKFIEDERHLVAHNLFLDARRRIEEWKEKKSFLDAEPNNPKPVQNKSPRKKGVGAKSGKGGRVAQVPTESAEELSDDEQAWKFLEEKRAEFEALENRANLFISAKENLSVDDDWTLAQTLFGVTTYYRREADGSLSIKIEGELHGIPLFEQLVVLRECDLYHTWAPFMQKSRKLAQLDKLDVVAWYIVGAPLLGLTRDACYRAVGCDCMREDGGVLLVAVGLNDSMEHGVKDAIGGKDADDTQSDSGAMRQPKPSPISGRAHSDSYDIHAGSPTQSQRQRSYQQSAVNMDSSNLVDTNVSSFLSRDAILQTIEIPPIPEGLGRGRMTIRNFSACVDILSPSSARSKLVVNVDPNLNFIPQSLIDFCMKRMCGVLLSRLQATARKVVKDPIKNPHSRRMREDVRFYRDWLLPKFRLHCDQLGWTMPPVGALTVSEEDLRAAGIFEGWRAEYEVASVSTQQLHDDDTNPSVVSAPASVRGDSSVTSRSSQSSRFGKLGNFFQERDRQAEIKRQMKIDSARERAAKRLQPAPFSYSKQARLKELRAAKLRAEERGQSRGMSGSTSSVCSVNTFRDMDDDDILKQDVLTFAVTFIANLVLIPLRSYAVSNFVISPNSPVLHSVVRLTAPNVVTLIMITLQAVTMWALLNSSLVFAFDSVDFGQRELVKNLDYGKKLYIESIRTYSSIGSVFVVAFSIAVAIIHNIFQRSLKNACAVLTGSVFADFSRRWVSQLEADTFLSNKLLPFFDVIAKAILALSTWVGYSLLNILTAASACFTSAASKVVHILDLILPSPLKTVATNIFHYMSNMLSSDIGVCQVEKDIESWRQRALEVSTFVTTRTCVFVIAFLLMARLILPKPVKESRKAVGVALQNVALKTDVMQRKESDVGDSLSSPSTSELLLRSASTDRKCSMDIISEEESSR